MSRRILMVIAPEQFRDEELQTPRQIFLQEGWQVDTVSTRHGTAKGMLGATEEVQQVLEEVDPALYDAVVVVGGMGSPEYLWNNQTLHDILRKVQGKGRVVSAICLSGAVLGNAGVAKGKKVTVWETPESVKCLTDHGAEFTGEPVTQDGNVVSANGPEAAEQFGRTIAERVKSLTPA